MSAAASSIPVRNITGDRNVHGNSNGNSNSNSIGNSRNGELVDKNIEFTLTKLKAKLLDRYYSHESRYFSHPKDERNIRHKIMMAEKHFISTSVFIIGSMGCGKRQLVNKILSKYYAIGRTLGLEGKLVATVNGASSLTDSQALLSISNQLMYRDPIDKNPNSVLEDLEIVLRQRRIALLPAIIVIENVDEFARREKQTLIYTLLDLMHKEDMFIVLIGISHCFHIHTMLEKRVMSRLNAQFVYITPAGTVDICRHMAKLLQIEIEELVDSDGEDDLIGESDSEIGRTRKRSRSNSLSSSSGRGCSNEDKEASLDPAFISRFNAAIIDAFGKMSVPAHLSSSSTAARPVWQRGALHNLVECAVNWGKDMRFFHAVILLMVSGLCAAEPVITTALASEALISQFQPTTIESLQSLPFVHIHIVAAACRVLLQTQSTDCSVERVVNEFDKLTGMLRRKEITHTALTGVFTTLASQGIFVLSNRSSRGSVGGSTVTVTEISGQTAVFMVLPPTEIQSAFRDTKKSSAAKEDLVLSDLIINKSGIKLGHPSTAVPIGSVAASLSTTIAAQARIQNLSATIQVRSCAPLQVAERVRRAVLEPLLPIACMNPTTGGGAWSYQEL